MRKASLAKRHEKGMGTRIYHRQIKDFHKRNEVILKNFVRWSFHFQVLTSNSTPPQYNYFLFDKKRKTIRGMHASNKLTTQESTAVQWVDPEIFDRQVSHLWGIKETSPRFASAGGDGDVSCI